MWDGKIKITSRDFIFIVCENSNLLFSFERFHWERNDAKIPSVFALIDIWYQVKH